MIKENKIKPKSVFLNLIIVLLCFLSTTVNALTNQDALIRANDFNTVVYNANEWDTFKNRTKEEIGAKYSKVAPAGPTYRDHVTTTYYDVPASTRKPYAAGVVSQDTLNVMTAATNYYRWLTGYSELKSVCKNEEYLQIQALARHFSWAHELDDSYKPADFPNDLWEKARPVNHNILAWRYTPRNAIAGWISEGYNLDKEAFDQIGHRIALLDPIITDIEFGYSGDTAIGKIVKKDMNANKDVPYGAFPVPGYMPVNKILPTYSAWTIALNSRMIRANNTSNVRVVVTNLGNNSSYECTVANGKLHIGDPMYTVPYLIFRQPDFKAGEKYKVVVTGLANSAGKAVKIEYTTEFFDVKDYADANARALENDAEYNEILIPSNYQSREALEKIAKILPKTVKVATDTGREATVSVAGDWIIDEEKQVFKNKADKNSKPDYLKDPYGVLDEEEVVIYYSYSATGSMSVSNNNPEEGTSGSISISRYYSNPSTMKLYQIDKNGNVKLRLNKDVDERSYEYKIDKFTGNDTGTYIGGFNLYSVFYITGIEDIIVNGKENPKYIVPTGLTAKYGDTLSSVELPEGFTWKDSTLSVGDAGVNTFYVTYTPTDTEKYNVVENIKVQVNVSKINPEYEVPTGITAEYGDTLDNVKLPEGFTWQDKTLSVGDQGTKTFKVTYTPKDTKNYNTIRNIDVNVIVKEKTLNIPTIENNALVYNFAEQTVKVNNYDSRYMELEGTTKATNVGTYSIKISLKDKNNYVWNNNTSEDITLTWNINKIDKITVNIKGNTKIEIYDGKEKTLEGYTYTSSNELYTDKYFQFSGNSKVTGTEKNTYYMGLTKDNFKNTNDNINKVEFIVTDGYLKITDKYVLTIDGLTYNNKQYDGEKVTPTGTLKVQDNKVDVSELEVKYYKLIDGVFQEVSIDDTVNVGKYQVIYKIPDTNKKYIGSVTYNYEITILTLNKPTVANEINTYNREMQEVKLNDFNSDYVNLVGEVKGKDANTYEVVVSLKDKENIIWSDNTTDDLKLNWTINKIDYVKVYINGNISKVIYDGEEKSIEGYTFKASKDLYKEEDFEFNGDSKVVGTELGIYKMDLKSEDFININDNFEKVEFIVTNGYLEIAVKEVLEINGYIYNNKPYTGNPYIPDGKLVVTDNKVNVEDLEVLYEGVGYTKYKSSNAPVNVGSYKVTYKISDNNPDYVGSVIYTFKIFKVNPRYDVPVGLEAKRNTKLSDVVLPVGFKWNEDVVLKPGLNKYMATYTPADTWNYNIIYNVEIEVNVKDYSMVEKLEYVSGKPLEFEVQVGNTKIVKVLFNNKELKQKDYKIEDNKVIVTEDYISSLESGSYKVEVVLEDGEKLSSVFTKAEEAVSEETDENTNSSGGIILLIIILVCSLVAIALFLFKRKKNN